MIWCFRLFHKTSILCIRLWIKKLSALQTLQALSLTTFVLRQGYINRFFCLTGFKCHWPCVRQASCLFNSLYVQKRLIFNKFYYAGDFVFDRFYARQVLCSTGIMFDMFMLDRRYVWQAFCSTGCLFDRLYVRQAFCLTGFMFDRLYVDRLYVQQDLGWTGYMFDRFNS